MTKKKVLIVDDDEDVRDFLEMEITDQGFDVKAASDGKQALSVFSEFHPNLIVCDYVMPGMGGVEVLSKLREFSTVPVIILSGHIKPEIASHLRKIGAQDVLEKPVDLTLLRMRVKSLAI